MKLVNSSIIIFYPFDESQNYKRMPFLFNDNAMTFLDLKDSVLIISGDVETLNDRLTLTEDSVNDIDDRVSSAETGISSLEDTTVELGNRLDQMEVTGEIYMILKQR